MFLTSIQSLLVLYVAFAQNTEIVISNGEDTGYIQVVLDGVDYRYDKEVLQRDRDGRARIHREKKIWQAAPGGSIRVRRSNWSTSARLLTVFVKYYADDGRFIGVAGPRIFSLDPAPGRRTLSWVFRKGDLNSQ